MKKIKLIKSITPILGAGIIATAIAPLCSCTTDQEDKKPDPTPTKGLVKLNAGLAPNEINPENLQQITTPLTITGDFSTKETIQVYVPTDAQATLQYRIADKQQAVWPNWTTIASGGSSAIEIHADEMIQFRAYSSTIGSFSSDKDQFIFYFDESPYGSESRWTIGGSLMSLLCQTPTKPEDPDEEMYATNELTQEYCFSNLFRNCRGIQNVATYLLPFKTLTKHCYENMFEGCYNLSECPCLPSLTLTEGCYQQMFYDCTSIQATPHLPATKLASQCYEEMFYGCSSLRIASLAYVGNFDSTYFKKWLGGTLTAGKIFYSGWDTEKGENAIPENFDKVLDQDLVDNETVTFEAVSDDETSALKSKPIVRCMKDEPITNVYSQLLTAHCAIYPDTDIFDHYLDKDGNELEVLSDDKTAQDLFALTKAEAKENGKLTAKYGFYPAEIPDVCNAITNADSTITVTWPTASNAQTVAQYCIVETGQEDNWISFFNGDPVDIPARKQVKLRAIQKSTAINSYLNFNISGDVKLEGSVMSLIKPDSVEDDNPTTVPAFGCCNMFAGSKGITEVSSDFLTKVDEKTPVAGINYMCYANMFNGCVNLKKAPDVPTTLGTRSGCFYQMFNECVSLEEFGDLPSGTIAEAYETNTYGTFEGMFRKCYNLKSVASSGITISGTVPHCAFDHMFSECRVLAKAPSFNLTSISNINWESGDVNFTKKSPFACMFEKCYAMTDASNVKITIPTVDSNRKVGYAGYYRMFAECTLLEQFPTFQTNITHVGKYAMQEMFTKCTKIKRVPTDKLKLLDMNSESTDEYSFFKMFYGCTSLVQPMYIKHDNLQKAMCYAYMYAGCSSLKVEKDDNWFAGPDPNDDSDHYFIKFCAWSDSGETFCKGTFDNISPNSSFTNGTPDHSVFKKSYKWCE